MPERRLAREQLDPRASAVLQQELPGLAVALDEEAMRDKLQECLLGAASRFRIERCNPGQALYTGGDVASLRYEMELTDLESGQPHERLVTAQVFRDGEACRQYADQVEGVAALLAGHPAADSLASPVALFDALNLVVHVFPVDAELPVLVQATDPEAVTTLLAETLGGKWEEHFTPRECRVELAHYGRKHRCTLRYVLSGHAADGTHAERVVYAKLTADGAGARTAPLIVELHEQLGGSGINIPDVLAYRAAEQMLLLPAIPGKPRVARLLKSRLAGAEAGGDLTLETAIEACGRVAAAIHNARTSTRQRRTLDDELAWLRDSARAVGRVSPQLGQQLEHWIDEAARAAAASDSLPLACCHGDFTYTQLVFDGQQPGLVDFDTICLAEPALDLGQFLAYQRLAVLKDQRSDAPLAAGEVEELCGRFIESYSAARGNRLGDRAHVMGRAAVYEILMLLRLAIHSWQKLKVSRLEHALTLVEERVRCLQ
jgi:hypothetical protein